MSFGQRGNKENLRRGQRESAERRRCPVCQRKGALGREYRSPTVAEVTVTQRDCRWCGATVAHTYNHLTMAGKITVYRGEGVRDGN